MADYCYYGLTGDGMIRAFVANTTHTVRKACEFHNLSPVCTAALGRLLTAASMMGCMLKEADANITLSIAGGGPIGKLCAVATSSGTVKGFVNNPYVDLPLRQDGKLDVGRAVGTDGLLGVVRDIGLKAPYVGNVPLVSGEIAEDLTRYFAQSEQTPTAVALGVRIGTDCIVENAQGIIIQLMPGADVKHIEHAERMLVNLQNISSFSNLDGVFLTQNGFDVTGHTLIEYKCDCSLQRTKNLLKGLGVDELRDMVEKGKDIEVTCHFCNQKYVFTTGKISKIISKLVDKGRN